MPPPPNWLLDLLPQQGRDLLQKGGWYVVLGLAALLLLIVLLVLARWLWRLLAANAEVSAENNLREDLADFPPAPVQTGSLRFAVQGVPARLRLVVLAPVGKQGDINVYKAEDLLEQVLWGLGTIAREDRPRIRVWPPQLSHQGFAMSFHRLTRKPEPDDRPSRWVLLAGRARAGERQVLVGLALWTEQPVNLPRFTLEPERWAEVIRIRPVEV